MALTFWARITSSTANADTLVIGNDPAVQIVFTDDDPNNPGVDSDGDLVLESTGGAPDPDTWVVVDGQTYTYTYDVVGTVPTGGGGNKFPPELQGKEVAVIVLSDGRYFFFILDGTGTQANMSTPQLQNGNQKLDDPEINPPPFCFAAGTDIATSTGPRKIDTLRAGDSVLAEDGRVVQIAWIGSTRYSCRRATSDQSVRPIRVQADAFGPGLPLRELVLSPQHRIVVEGPECELLFGNPRVFVIARHLPDSVATSPEPDEDVVYFHMLFGQHEVVLANGLPSESFQPARRMIETIAGAARASLDATLDVLGRDAMLTRSDALPTIASYEARVLSHWAEKQGSQGGRLAGCSAERRLDA